MRVIAGSLRGVLVLILVILAGPFLACGEDEHAGEGLATSPAVTPAPMIVAQPTLPPTDDRTDIYTMRRQDMVKSQIQERGITNEDVLRAMEKVPRHEFVPTNYLNQAYEDYPLPIGYGQTISQP